MSAEEQSNTNINTLKPLPHARCNYIGLGDKILVGGYPPGIQELEDWGVNIFVNCQQQQYQVSDKSVLEYFPIPPGRAPGIKKSTELINRLHDYYYQGKTIYIHCSGGHGRAGTIGGLLLGKICGMDAVNCIYYLGQWRDTRIDKSRNFIPTPESEGQVKLLLTQLPVPGLTLEQTLQQYDHILNRKDKAWLRRVKRERAEWQKYHSNE